MEEPRVQPRDKVVFEFVIDMIDSGEAPRAMVIGADVWPDPVLAGCGAWRLAGSVRQSIGNHVYRSPRMDMQTTMQRPVTIAVIFCSDCKLTQQNVSAWHQVTQTLQQLSSFKDYSTISTDSKCVQMRENLANASTGSRALYEAA